MVNWFAVYTQPGFEMKAAENLSRKKIETYCPVINLYKKNDGIKKLCVEPLFASFIYVRMKESELDKLKSADSSVNIMYWLQKPAVIKDIEIEMVKAFLKEYENVRIEKSEVRINEIVKLVKEPYIQGNIEIEYYNQIKLVLPTMGFTLFAVIDLGDKEVVKQKKTTFLPQTDTKLVFGSDR